MKYKKNSMEKRFTNLEWQGQVCMQIHPDATILRRVFATGLVGHRPWPSRYPKRLGSRCTCCVGFGFQNELKRTKHSNETFYLNSTKKHKALANIYYINSFPLVFEHCQLCFSNKRGETK